MGINALLIFVLTLGRASSPVLAIAAPPTEQAVCSRLSRAEALLKERTDIVEKQKKEHSLWRKLYDFGARLSEYPRKAEQLLEDARMKVRNARIRSLCFLPEDQRHFPEDPRLKSQLLEQVNFEIGEALVALQLSAEIWFSYRNDSELSAQCEQHREESRYPLKPVPALALARATDIAAEQFESKDETSGTPPSGFPGFPESVLSAPQPPNANPQKKPSRPTRPDAIREQDKKDVAKLLDAVSQSNEATQELMDEITPVQVPSTQRLIKQAQKAMIAHKGGMPPNLDFYRFKLDGEIRDRGLSVTRKQDREARARWDAITKEFTAPSDADEETKSRLRRRLVSSLHKNYYKAYRRDYALLFDGVLGKGGNCEMLSGMFYAAFMQANLMPIGKTHVYAQSFLGHIQLVEYDEENKTVYDFATKKTLSEVKSTLYNPLLLVHGYLKAHNANTVLDVKALRAVSATTKSPSGKQAPLANLSFVYRTNTNLKLPEESIPFTMDPVPETADLPSPDEFESDGRDWTTVLNDSMGVKPEAPSGEVDSGTVFAMQDLPADRSQELHNDSYKLFQCNWGPQHNGRSNCIGFIFRNKKDAQAYSAAAPDSDARKALLYDLQAESIHLRVTSPAMRKYEQLILNPKDALKDDLERAARVSADGKNELLSVTFEINNLYSDFKYEHRGNGKSDEEMKAEFEKWLLARVPEVKTVQRIRDIARKRVESNVGLYVKTIDEIMNRRASTDFSLGADNLLLDQADLLAPRYDLQHEKRQPGVFSPYINYLADPKKVALRGAVSPAKPQERPSQIAPVGTVPPKPPNATIERNEKTAETLVSSRTMEALLGHFDSNVDLPPSTFCAQFTPEFIEAVSGSNFMTNVLFRKGILECVLSNWNFAIKRGERAPEPSYCSGPFGQRIPRAVAVSLYLRFKFFNGSNLSNTVCAYFDDPPRSSSCMTVKDYVRLLKQELKL